MDYIDRTVVMEVWRGRYIDWSYLPSVGVAGGILVCWDHRVVKKEEEEEVGSFSVSCLFRCIGDDFRWVFTRVYGPVRGAERPLFLLFGGQRHGV